MDVPSIDNKLWTDVVSGLVNCELNSLALKILLARLNLMVKQHPEAPNVQKCAGELREFFMKNAGMPTVMHDLEAIFQKRGAK